MTEELRPARPVLPGRILKQELVARGWTQKDLSVILNRPEQMISEIANGAKQITPETSVELGQAFGTSPEFWYNLEANYRLELARRHSDDDAIVRRSRLFAVLPVRALFVRGWLATTDSVDELERNILQLLQVNSLEQVPQVAARLRCSTVRQPNIYAQIAWLRRVEHNAAGQTPASWQPGRLVARMGDLLALAERAEDVALVPQVLAELGIRFVLLRHLERSYLDGAALFSADRPIVALSLRYDRIDAFWFTLLHELAHVLEGGNVAYLDRLDPGKTGDDETAVMQDPDASEEAANRRAGDWLLEPQAFEQFVRHTQPYFGRARIAAFAADQHRHPGIVLGRLQRMGLVPYKNLRGWLVKVSPFLGDWIRD